MTSVEWLTAGVVCVICLVLSAFFSGSEVALFSLRRTEREQMVRSGREVDRRVLLLLSTPRRLVATVLAANELINGVLAVTIFAVCANSLTLAPWATVALAVGVVLMLVVMFAEHLPRTLAMKAPVAWARGAALPLRIAWYLLTPLRWLLHAVSEGVLRQLGAAARAPRRDLSEQEFRRLVDAGSAQGQVDARERRLIHRVFEFGDKNVGQIMTPRDKMVAVAYDLPLARLCKEVAARGFSRVPVYQKSLDNIRGIVHAKDLVHGAAGRPFAELLHEPLFVPRTTPLKRLFITFKQKKVHVAIVVNEYGKVLGLVTMDDVLSQLFGSIRDEREALQATRRPRGARTPMAGVPITGGGDRLDATPTPRPSAPALRGGRVEDDDLTPPPKEPA